MRTVIIAGIVIITALWLWYSGIEKILTEPAPANFVSDL